MPAAIYSQFNDLRYLYRFVIEINQRKQGEGLLLSQMLINRAKWQVRSERKIYAEFNHETEIDIASAIATGTLMEDWIAQQVAVGCKDTQSLRRLWLQTAGIITTFLMHHEGQQIDVGTTKKPDYQNESDSRALLRF